VRVEWLEDALASLTAEADYIAGDNPDAADRFIETSSLPSIGLPNSRHQAGRAVFWARANWW
jgi:hypothetical protein